MSEEETSRERAGGNRATGCAPSILYLTERRGSPESKEEVEGGGGHSGPNLKDNKERRGRGPSAAEEEERDGGGATKLGITGTTFSNKVPCPHVRAYKSKGDGRKSEEGLAKKNNKR